MPLSRQALRSSSKNKYRVGTEKLNTPSSERPATLKVRKSTEMEQKMSKKQRRKHSPAFKAHVALGALAGDKTLVLLS
jgi:hypothetical protein